MTVAFIVGFVVMLLLYEESVWDLGNYLDGLLSPPDTIIFGADSEIMMNCGLLGSMIGLMLFSIPGCMFIAGTLRNQIRQLRGTGGDTPQPGVPVFSSMNQRHYLVAVGFGASIYAASFPALVQTRVYLTPTSIGWESLISFKQQRPIPNTEVTGVMLKCSFVGEDLRSGFWGYIVTLNLRDGRTVSFPREKTAAATPRMTVERAVLVRTHVPVDSSDVERGCHIPLFGV